MRTIPLPSRCKRLGLTVAVAATMAAAFSAAPSAASAALPGELWTVCPTGSGAGQCNLPRGVAVSPVSGDIFVADSGNARINEFTAWGEFVKAWGWGVRDGDSEPQVCTTETGCERGLSGAGTGQFSLPQGLAFDASGDLYVIDQNNFRVEKFSAAGAFILMFGGGVNKTRVAEAGASEDEKNVCTAASGDVCGAGMSGTAPGQFDWSWPQFPGTYGVGSYVAIAPGAQETIYIGDLGRIERFDLAGTSLGDLPDPEGLLTNKPVKSLAVDSASGNLFAAMEDPSQVGRILSNVTKLSPSGIRLCTAAVDSPTTIAVGGDGIYVYEQPKPLNSGASTEASIREFGLNCAETGHFVAAAVSAASATGLPQSTGLATSEGCGIAGLGKGPDIYVASLNEGVRAFGPTPDPTICPPPRRQPDIDNQAAVTVGTVDAVVRAQINPHFWPDTSYFVEFGTEDCRNGPGACSHRAVVSGAELNGQADRFFDTANVPLSGLRPNTTYHYRFVAQSGGGGPVFGEGSLSCALEAGCGTGGSFTTYPPPAVPKNCPQNQEFRTGPAAFLPDCRAYEMVSPVDKGGGDIAALGGADHNSPARLDQSTADGEKLTYSSFRAFGDAAGAPFSSQYMAARHPDSGWRSTNITEPAHGYTLVEVLLLESPYKAFTPDLCHSWVFQVSQERLTADAPVGYPDLYRRSNCGAGAGSLEAMVTATPEVEPRNFKPTIQGSSADGTVSIFRSTGRLTTDAAPCPSGEDCKVQLYEHRVGEGTHLVCILPGNVASSESCSAGTAKNIDNGGTGFFLDDNVQHAVSTDASRIYWSQEDGRLYLRVDGRRTYPVSELPESVFWGAAADGERAIFTAGSLAQSQAVLKAFTLASGSSKVIAGGVAGVAGVSDDGLRAYFVSTEALTGDQRNSEGAKAVAGQPNLYFYDGAASGPQIVYIATVDARDASQTASSSPVSRSPQTRTSRVSPDGLRLVFTATASLTGYDNTDLVSGQADSEVFLYDSTIGGAGRLACVSCLPGGARPSGRELPGRIWASGQIPGWSYQQYPGRVLSPSGGRVFFESFDPLVLRDRNGKQDVYEWEPGSSQSDCELSKGAELFVASSHGCISLISSGESNTDSEFVDASADGRDVFFRTGSSLVRQDPGLGDIYDAREGGGFRSPEPSLPCEGGSCQNPPPPPSEVTPASSAFAGPGNVRAHKPRAKRCLASKKRVMRGKRRATGRCKRKGAKRSHHVKHHRKHHRKGQGKARAQSKARGGRAAR